MAQLKNSRSHVQPKDIVNYWAETIDSSELIVNSDQAETHCWSCGDESDLQQCHIIPHALGGKCESSNLVLLCNLCHRENPNVCSVELYWDWLRSRAEMNVFTFGGFWVSRAFTEYEKIYGTSFADDLKPIIMKMLEQMYEINIITGECSKVTNQEEINRRAEEDLVKFCEDKFVTDGQRHNPSTLANLCRMYIVEKKKSLSIE